MIYVASPYSHPEVNVRFDRYLSVRAFVDYLTAQGLTAYSPIAYYHPIAERIGHATDADTWRQHNMTMLRRADAMYVLRLEGWETSAGIAMEFDMCVRLYIDVKQFTTHYDLIEDH